MILMKLILGLRKNFVSYHAKDQLHQNISLTSVIQITPPVTPSPPPIYPSPPLAISGISDQGL